MDNSHQVPDASVGHEAGVIESVAFDLKRSNLRRVCYLVVSALSLFALVNTYNGYYLLAAIESGVAFTVLLLILADKHWLFPIHRLTDPLVILATVLYSYLFMTGGVDGTGIYWAFIFPFVAYFLKGIQQGLIWSVIFFLINALFVLSVLMMHWPLPYSQETLERALLVYLLVAAFAYYYESLHFKRQYQMLLDKDRFELLIENSYDVIAIVDPVGTLLFMTPSIEQMTGSSPGELIDRNAFDFIHPEDAQEVRKAMARLVFNRKGVERQEFRFLRKDGGCVYLEAIGRPVVDAEGVLTVIVNARDISERKQVEEMIRSQELSLTQQFSELNNIYSTAPIGMGFVDTKLRFVRINQVLADINGLPVSEHIGRSLKEVAPELAPQLEPVYLSVLQTGEPVDNFEIHRETVGQPGQMSDYLASYHPVKDESGNIIGVSIFVQDVTDQHRLEEQFHQAQKMEAIGTLVGGIAHDFNNTLAAMQGNLYLAKMYTDESAPSMEKLRNLENLGAHAAEIVTQLMTFARKGLVKMSEISLTGLVKDTMKLSGSLIREDIEHVCDICDEDLIIKGDVSQLQQVIINLLSNASDAVDGTQQPKIVCRLSPFSADTAFLQRHPDEARSRFAHMVVEDNGCGITESVRTHIFEPFFTTKDVGKGTGLGLAMAYGAVQTHKGLIEVDSTPDHGTAIHIYLPLEKVASSLRASTSTGGPGDEIILTRQGTILVVDDNEKILWATEQVMQKLGYRTIGAGDGQEALALFNQNRDKIDLVISDVVMPKMGGVESVTAMRKTRADLPVIFITGYDKEKTVIPEVLSASSAFLTKPFSFAHLNELVANMIRADASKKTE